MQADEYTWEVSCGPLIHIDYSHSYCFICTLYKEYHVLIIKISFSILNSPTPIILYIYFSILTTMYFIQPSQIPSTFSTRFLFPFFFHLFSFFFFIYVFLFFPFFSGEVQKPTSCGPSSNPAYDQRNLVNGCSTSRGPRVNADAEAIRTHLPLFYPSKSNILSWSSSHRDSAIYINFSHNHHFYSFPLSQLAYILFNHP